MCTEFQLENLKGRNHVGDLASVKIQLATSYLEVFHHLFSHSKQIQGLYLKLGHSHSVSSPFQFIKHNHLLTSFNGIYLNSWYSVVKNLRNRTYSSPILSTPLTTCLHPQSFPSLPVCNNLPLQLYYQCLYISVFPFLSNHVCVAKGQVFISATSIHILTLSPHVHISLLYFV